jgi:hypothetical protein
MRVYGKTHRSGRHGELQARGVRPDPHLGHRDNVVLISEWDTFYGQTLPKAVERVFAPDDFEHPWIHKFTHLRGLDGLLLSSEGTRERKQCRRGRILQD